MSAPFIGEIRVFANSYVPDDSWFPCDGRQLDVNDYQALCAVIGFTYGGDGRNYFNLPDLRGTAPVQQGMGENYLYRIGQPVGEVFETLDEKTLANHTHAANATSAKATSSDPTGRIWARSSGVALYAMTNDDPVPMYSGALDVSGSGEAHSNVQPCLGMYFAIAWDGVFPVRPEA